MPVPAGGTITTDLTTAVGKVRLLITDTTEPSLFTDAQVQAFLTLEGDDVRMAAAQALDTIASSEALISKKITTQDLSTDGPAVAKELRERAATLRADTRALAAAGVFEVVPMWSFPAPDPYGDYLI